MKSLIYYFLLALIFWGCSDVSCPEEVDISNISIDLKVERLDREMFNLKSKQEIRDFLNRHKLFGSAFLGVSNYPHDSLLINNIYRLTKDPYMDSLYQETQRIFGDFSDIKREFENAFRHLKAYYPQAKIPIIKTVITGFGQDLFVSDSLIIVGLDYFLGKDARYRPVDYPLYILRRYEKEYIVPTCMLNISKLYNLSNYQDNTVLADMIFYGKSYYFTKRMMPCAPDSLIIPYTAQELSDVKENHDIIWAHFVENQLIFETNYFIKQKYLEERPNIPEIGPKCPGRVGTWVGWEIVKSYFHQNPEIGLKQLMANQDAQAIFSQSKYKPIPR
ncbi:MAG: gliding motility lipoprotein GldB [Bacteroidetes bacterium]|nr:gliding motility lipoprotein GldB [Bacteroidota bacterium]